MQLDTFPLACLPLGLLLVIELWSCCVSDIDHIMLYGLTEYGFTLYAAGMGASPSGCLPLGLLLVIELWSCCVYDIDHIMLYGLT